MPNNYTERLNFACDMEMHKAIRDVSIKQNISVGALCRLAVDEYVSKALFDTRSKETLKKIQQYFFTWDNSAVHKK